MTTHSHSVSATAVDQRPDWARVRINVVADLLACSESTVRRRIRAGVIPQPIKEGGTLVWRIGDLRRALA
ncbi:helix-turn-helix transcriptional regulator [Robbsia andropogonis]|uniref:helix-turn-helix transcriptional regulator n=1 Tax=Robbsia andropogonis TaxID=28092 RepID=UPI003D19AB0B